MKTRHRSAFTLIELLTVIAIIAILAGFTAAALPRALERAKIARVEADFNQLRTALNVYLTESIYKTFPPAYGFRTFSSRGVSLSNLDVTSPLMFNFTPYMESLGYYRTFDLYDNFASGGADTDRNQEISHLEFSPLEPFNGPLYGTSAFPIQGEDPTLMEVAERPYIYIPVNPDVFRKFKIAVEREYPNGWWGDEWPNAADSIDIISPRYQACVLLSVSPGEHTGGIASPPQSFFDSLPDNIRRAPYEAICLRGYYLATRDLNNNGELDFAFDARAHRNEDKNLIDFTGDPLGYRLPDGSLGYGPMIYKIGAQ